MVWELFNLFTLITIYYLNYLTYLRPTWQSDKNVTEPLMTKTSLRHSIVTVFTMSPDSTLRRVTAREYTSFVCNQLSLLFLAG